MPASVRLHDICTGHGCYPPRPNIQGSPNVWVNGRPKHRVTDAWASHCCGDCHGSVQATGSPNVWVNGLAAARIGDLVACGSRNLTGSHNVFINEPYPEDVER